MLYYMHIFPSPVGWFTATWSAQGLWSLQLPVSQPEGAFACLIDTSQGHRLPPPEIGDSLHFLEREVQGYFQGYPVSFSSIPVDLSWCTSFQRRVLKCVRDVGYGSVVSYRQVARAVGQPRAARAVGNALRANRTPLVIPCHRVIRSDGTPGGFSLGFDWKKHLLELEGNSPVTLGGGDRFSND